MIGFLIFCVIVLSLWWMVQNLFRPRVVHTRPVDFTKTREFRELKRAVRDANAEFEGVKRDYETLLALAVQETDYTPKPPSRRKHWIPRYNEAEAFRYLSVAGTFHYFKRDGHVEYCGTDNCYKIWVRRVRTGEVLWMPTKELDPCDLSEATNDTATDDGRISP